MASTAQTLISAAVAAGYNALSERDLWECLLYAAQTGGSGGASLVQGNYARSSSNIPTPTSTPAFAIDTSTGRLWVYWGTPTPTWH